jgi:hypothetical protein
MLLEKILNILLCSWNTSRKIGKEYKCPEIYKWVDIFEALIQFWKYSATF